jgi:hypothetical protein
VSEAIENLSLVEVADALYRGDVTAVAVTENAVKRLCDLGPVYNCTMTLQAEQALDRARSLDAARAAATVPSDLFTAFRLRTRICFIGPGARHARFTDPQGCDRAIDRHGVESAHRGGLGS